MTMIKDGHQQLNSHQTGQNKNYHAIGTSHDTKPRKTLNACTHHKDKQHRHRRPLQKLE